MPTPSSDNFKHFICHAGEPHSKYITYLFGKVELGASISYFFGWRINFLIEYYLSSKAFDMRAKWYSGWVIKITPKDQIHIL